MSRISNMISQVATLKRNLNKASNIGVAATVLSIFNGNDDLVSFDPNPVDGPFRRVTLCAVPSGSFFYAKPMDPTKPTSHMVRFGPMYGPPSNDAFEEVNAVFAAQAAARGAAATAKEVQRHETGQQLTPEQSEKLTEADAISSIERYRKEHQARLIEKMKELS